MPWKPCPFDKEIDETKKKMEPGDRTEIYCSDCGARAELIMGEGLSLAYSKNCSSRPDNYIPLTSRESER